MTEKYIIEISYDIPPKVGLRYLHLREWPKIGTSFNYDTDRYDETFEGPRRFLLKALDKIEKYYGDKVDNLVIIIKKNTWD